MTLSNPLVSVLIPLYNSEQYINETIQSVLNQTYRNVEIIVVDDHSNDHGKEMVEKYNDQRIKIYDNPDKGAQSARNYAFTMSKGDYVMFLDSDDLISKGKIEKHMEELQNLNDEYALTFSSYLIMGTDGQESYQPRRIDHDYNCPVDLLIDMWDYGEYNLPHCYLMHRKLVVKAGSWNEILLKNQDGEFFSRIVACSSYVKYIPEEKAFWRMHEGSISHSYGKERYKSQIISYKIVSEVILSLDNTQRARIACAKNLGRWMVEGYPNNRYFLKYANLLLKKWQQPIIIPFMGKKFTILRIFLGWRLAKRLLPYL